MYHVIRRAVDLVNRDADLAALIIAGTGDVIAPGTRDACGVRKLDRGLWAGLSRQERLADRIKQEQ
jgi:hypothetical protein